LYKVLGKFFIGYIIGISYSTVHGTIIVDEYDTIPIGQLAHAF